MICPTPTNHVRNLDEELDIDEYNSTSPPPSDLTQIPPDHLISLFTRRLLTVIQRDNIGLLKSTMKLFQNSTKLNIDFCMYDCSAFDAAWKAASDVLASHNSVSSSTPNPPSPLSSQHSLQPRDSFKPPKPTTPLHEDTLNFEINPTTPLHEDTLNFEINPTTPLHEDTLNFEINPITPLHEDTLTFEINPTTPLHEDTLTFEINPTTPLHEDTLTFEMNSATPLHEDTSNGQPPETPHQEVQRCTRNTPCKLPGCMICQTPTKPGFSNSLVSPTYSNPPIVPDPLSNPEVPTNPLEPDLPNNPNPTTNPAHPIEPDPLAKPARPIEPDPQPHLGLHRSEESSSSSEFQTRVCSG
jgi:hypothetical protein